MAFIRYETETGITNGVWSDGYDCEQNQLFDGLYSMIEADDEFSWEIGNNELIVNGCYKVIDNKIEIYQDGLVDYATNLVRTQRAIKLKEEVDPMLSNVFRFQSLPQETQDAWLDYRQKLLDITKQEGYPLDVIWPTKPE